MRNIEKEHPDVISQRELASTEVGPRVAWTMTVAFVAIIVLVPALQLVFELTRAQPVQSLDVLRPLAAAGRALWSGGGSADGEGRAARFWTELKPIFSAEFLHRYEDALGDASVIKQSVQPRVQELLTAWGGFGNDKCAVGLDGWLFYQPGVDYVAGPGVLNEEVLRIRTKNQIDRKGIQNPCPDPRPAILQFHETCRKAGVHLVLVPLPDKAMLVPDRLTRRLACTAPMPPPNNRDYARFVEQLREQGVDVFDPAPAELKPGEPPRFLAQDTHWTPQYMEEVAERLAAHVSGKVALPPPPQPFAVRTEECQVSNIGDLVAMLKLTPQQQLYQPQTVTIRRVLDAATGAPWQARLEADVLLLGDSYANIYTDGAEGLKWGDSAGLAPQLSRFLRRPLDVIAKNGSGASLTRFELARRADPFGGKRVIIWAFAIRDLTHDDVQWELVDIKAKPKPAQPPPEVDTGKPLVVSAILRTAPRFRNPAGNPYDNALITLKFAVRKIESGKAEDLKEGAEFLVTLPVVRNRAVQPVARFQAGSVYRLTLTRDLPPNLPKAATTWQGFGEVRMGELPELWAAEAQAD